jgi:hypothetical protein
MECPTTRRKCLSLIASVFDPMGFIAPYLLRPKKALQKMCNLKLGWDDAIPEEHLAIIWKWQETLDKIQTHQIPRWLKTEVMGNIVSTQLHHFSDASEDGYGCISYIRYEDDEGNICVSFLMGKSRITPLKHVTIPRLELQAAVLSIENDMFLKEELDMHVDETFYWTDSMTVLRYLNNKETRYRTFVANRVGKILDHSSEAMWQFVRSEENPADLSSRGIEVQ